MRFIFGRGWVLCDETNGTDGNGATGGAAGAEDVVVEGDDTVVEGDQTQGGKKQEPAAGEKKDEPKDMKSAIDVALGYKKDAEGNRLDAAGNITHDKDGKAVEVKVVTKAGAKPVAEGKETDTHHANGKPKANDKGQALDDKGQFVKQAPAKVKTAAELALKPEEMKGLHAKTSARFGEVITALKAHEGTIAKQGDTIKVLTEARDTILGVMEETKTTQEQLAAYLEFNALLQSSDTKDLESALKMIEDQRTALYKVLGREPAGGGLDLLADFPDLKKQVDDEEITRQAALEIAHSRRDRAARATAEQRRASGERTQQQTASARKQESESALKGIEGWTAEVSKSDLDYKAKEDILLPQIEEILKEYEPKLWLPTIKRLYAGITVQKAAAPAGGDKNKPLRPSAARPGNKQPNSMLDAINQGLGYAGAEKG